MDWVEILRWVIAILTGIAAVSPAVVKLVKVVRELVENEQQVVIDNAKKVELLEKAMKLMKKAETMYQEGKTKKDWVMLGVDEAASAIGYELSEQDRTDISNMIDAMCNMAKVVNTKAGE